MDNYLEHLDDVLKTCKPLVRNADNEDLGGMPSGPFLVGDVDEVNGEAAREIEGFKATRYELLELAKHWAHTALELDYFCFIYSSYGSDWTRREIFARRRLARIAALVGEDAVSAVVDDVYKDFAKTCDPKVWHVFLNGTHEERRAVQDEIMRQMCPEEPAAAED